MDWMKFFSVFVKNAVSGLIGSVLVFGLIGLLLAGRDGMINGALAGFYLSLVGIPIMGGLIAVKYWSEFTGRWGEASIREQTEGTQD